MSHLRPFIAIHSRALQHLILDALARRIGALCFSLPLRITLTRLLLAEWLGVALIVFGTACTSPPTIPVTVKVAINATPVPTVNPSPGRWEITGVNPRDVSGDKGWKWVSIEIVLENKSYVYASPKIKTTGVKLYTDTTNSYDADTYKTTGSVFTKVEEIAFTAKIPHGYRMKGEYQGDAVVSYCFRASIPEQSKPMFLKMNGYAGEIWIYPNPPLVMPRGVEFVPLRAPKTEVDVGGRAKLVLGEFDRKPGWPPIHDRISGVITATNIISSANTTVSLQILPLGDDGIVGAAFTETPECKPKLVLGPGQAEVSRICAIIPHRAKNIHIILLGDLNEVCDTQAPNPP
ncbi:MAG: hypothetical protein FJ009_14300 [Chloroflexi bacterium]|nr:hypothetical protein [Chloroflexota bacterium]